MNSEKIKRDRILFLYRQNPDAALIEATFWVNQEPDVAASWSMRAYVYSSLRLHEKAMSDLNKVIDIQPSEPCNHIKKGRLLIKMKDFSGAIASMTECLNLGTQNNYTYYRVSALLCRALCYCKIDMFDEAEADLLEVDDDLPLWIDRLRSKAELLEACRNKRID